MIISQIGFLILLACSTAAAQSVGDDFFPLALGNEWTYRYLDVSEEFLYELGGADSGRASYTILTKDVTADSIVWGIREARDITRISYSFWMGVTVISREPVRDTVMFTLVEDLKGIHQIVRRGNAEKNWQSVFCVMAHTSDTSKVFRYIPEQQVDTLEKSTGWNWVPTSKYPPTYVVNWTLQRGVGLRSVAFSSPGVVGNSYRTQHQLMSQTILSAPWSGAPVHPDDFMIGNNYPSPFNTSTVLSLSLGSRERITLTIVDLLGRQIAGLLDDTVGPGRLSIVWDASKQASGTYFAQVRTSRSMKCVRLLLLK
jgi:hypothetical protein